MEVINAFNLAIPIEILNDKEISLNIKCFYTVVVMLCKKKGYCWGTNKYFAKLFGQSIRTISEWVKKLIEHNFLISQMIYADKKHKKNQRRLRLVNNSNTVSTSRYTWKNFHMPKSDSKHDKSGKAPKKSPKVLYKSFNKDLYINSVFPTEKHNTRAHARTSETKKYIAKKFDDKKRTPEGVLRVVEKNKLSLKYNSTLEAQGVSIHPEKWYIFNAPKSIDVKRVPEGTLSTVENIIKVLNQEVSAHYKADAKETLGLIVPLLKFGYNLADFAKVIATKCKDWLNTPFAKYLRPKTLFRADHFEDYLTQSAQKSQEKINYKNPTKEPVNKFANFKQRKWDFAQIEYLNLLDDNEPYTEEGMAEYRKRYEARETAKAKREAENPRPTRFHNFEQRKWDFALIEKLAQED